MRPLVAVLVLALIPVSTCLGWEASASARMACCHHEHPNKATTQAAADDCCAGHEQARQPASTPLLAAPPASFAPAWLIVAFVDLTDIVASSLFSRDSVRLPQRGSPGAFSPPLRV
jgi:hypothetical protein